MCSSLKLILAVLLLTLLGSITIGAQAVSRVGARPKNVPAAVFPKIALASGLTGKVSVLVEVDQNGNVMSATDPIGPDWICPAVMRPDIIAMRESAVEAAEKATFYPATENGEPVTSTFRLDFQFGSKRPEPKERAAGATVVGERIDSAPVAGAGNPTAARRLEMPIVLGSDIKPVNSSPRPDESDAPLDNPSKTISGGVLNGKAISLPKPAYPPAARAVRASGAVPVQILILEDGSIFSAEAVGGHPLLQAASRIAACSASFSPTLLEGQPVKVSGIITYNFVP
jgi:outer membrane biosynthesis protein TonB